MGPCLRTRRRAYRPQAVSGRNRRHCEHAVVACGAGKATSDRTPRSQIRGMPVLRKLHEYSPAALLLTGIVGAERGMAHVTASTRLNVPDRRDGVPSPGPGPSHWPASPATLEPARGGGAHRHHRDPRGGHGDSDDGHRGSGCRTACRPDMRARRAATLIAIDRIRTSRGSVAEKTHSTHTARKILGRTRRCSPGQPVGCGRTAPIGSAPVMLRPK